MVRLGAGEHSSNPGPDISTLSAIALVTETAHQLGEGSGNARHVPARFAYGNGKPETGDRRRHDMKGVTWVAVGPGVRQWSDDLDELRDRTGITMADDQRQGIALRRPDVEEVDRLAVDLGRELREGVESRLLLPPVEPGAPILGKFFEVLERHTAAPVEPR